MSTGAPSRTGISCQAEAPCRVDLAGGTLDIWPLYLFHPGAVTVNFAVNVLTRCRITPLAGKRIRLRSVDTRREEEFSNLDALCSARKYKHGLAVQLLRFFAPEGGLELETDSESPAGAGISGSSALMIASAAALARFTGREIEHEQIRVIAQNIEAQVIRVPTGCQDYYPALYGGVSAIHLDPDGIHRQVIGIAAEEIDHRFVLAYTGAPRQSGINNWEVFKAHITGDRRIFRNFERISQIAQSMHEALVQGDWQTVAKLMREEWKLRKTNAPGITTPLIEKIVGAATQSGALSAKVCGAGGGGCVVFLTEPEAREKVVEAIRKCGCQVLPAKVASEGLRITP
ncbi:MAG TPA: GHMP kinase [Candidatus Angelobacter sp.]|jgi:D-glycero-alpha-D-manno-heptose-7-phosphate kinase|nr:GHMP kinase [Candidatus Angelobacter sp.]